MPLSFLLAVTHQHRHTTTWVAVHLVQLALETRRLFIAGRASFSRNVVLAGAYWREDMFLGEDNHNRHVYLVEVFRLVDNPLVERRLKSSFFWKTLLQLECICLCRPRENAHPVDLTRTQVSCTPTIVRIESRKGALHAAALACPAAAAAAAAAAALDVL